MSNNIIEIFKTITAIPRCSGTHKPFIEYMQNLSKELGYLCLVDETNNILCKKENSNATLAFQSHYDIVCLKDNCVPQIVQNGDILTRRSSVPISTRQTNNRFLYRRKTQPLIDSGY